MSKFDLVVFDFDGTLFDSDLALVKIALKMSETFLVKKDLSIDDLLFINGPSLDETLPLIFPGVDIEVLRAKYYEIALDSARDITLFKQAKPLLAQLKKQKIDVAIFTSRSRPSTELILKQHGLQNEFKMVVCGSDGFAKKPSGEGLVHLLTTLGVKPNRALYVGDNWRDILAGNDAGVPVAFLKPYRRMHKLDIKAQYTINDINEVLEVIENGE